ncbi:MAG: nucleotide pyrophosphatase [Nitrospinota bacterium]|nr:MAG: nucleotide pyrophosphatase [Nitrospinota bacterium]
MHSVYPPLSSVAWASFLTGKNPGKHGIYGFLDRSFSPYKLYIPHARYLRGETLWEILSRQGKRVISINVPLTFPPRPVNGIIVGGFLSPSLQKAVYPKGIAPILQKLGYRIDVDIQRGKESRIALLADLQETLSRRVEAATYLLKHEAWDCFMLHIMETDRLHHFFWEAYEEPHSPYAGAFLRFYQHLDTLLGQFRALLDAHTLFLMLSDHGFCRLKRELYLNRWLQVTGWLRFTTPTPQSILDLHPASKAYSLNPGRLYIHLQGREPGGQVRPGLEYEVARGELRRQLLQLTDPEEHTPVFQRIEDREKLYRGEALDLAPDLLAIPAEGYDLKGEVGMPNLWQRGTFTGTHTYDNAFFYANTAFQPPPSLSIMDIMPTILHYLHLPLPGDLDGQAVSLEPV